MAYDEDLAARVRDVFGLRDDLREQKMFGGLAFMVGGHMCVGILGDELLVRLDAERGDAALERPGVRPMDFTGRPMSGFIMVGPDALAGVELEAWIDEALAFVGTLPPKSAKRR